MSSKESQMRIMGRDIMPARVDGPPDVYTASRFVLVKPSWIGDAQVAICVLCNNKFNQIRRKHHCRMCGKVLCSKCCKDKLPLPQLGLIDPERACVGCGAVADLVAQAFSNLPEFKIKSAQGLSKLAKDPDTVGKVVELGGLQAMVFLAKTENDQINKSLHGAGADADSDADADPDTDAKGYNELVTDGLHSLSTHPQLHGMLAEAGAIKAICGCLNEAQANQDNLLIESISSLRIFCKSPELKTRAIEEGALQPVLGLCTNENEAVSLMAVSTLSLIVEHPGTHDAVIENARDALPRILSLTASSDEQMQEVALKTLCHLSLGTEWHRHRILQEDYTSGRSLLKALKSNPKNGQILCNVACLIGNLATNVEDQSSLSDLLESLCSLLNTKAGNQELTCAVARAFANLSDHAQTTPKALRYMCDIVNKCLKSSHLETRLHATRGILHLLKHSTKQTTKELLRNGAGEFLEVLATTPELTDTLVTSLLQTAPEKARPL